MMTLLEAETDSIARTLANARRALLDSRVAAGHWEGELSSSALSTATAVFALWVYLREARSPSCLAASLARRGPLLVPNDAGPRPESETAVGRQGEAVALSPSPGTPGDAKVPLEAPSLALPRSTGGGNFGNKVPPDSGKSVPSADPTGIALRSSINGLIRNGAAWLAAHQNADGGWGDTTDSISNISTTALCWAALSNAGGTEAEKQAVLRAEAALAVFVGSALRTVSSGTDESVRSDPGNSFGPDVPACGFDAKTQAGRPCHGPLDPAALAEAIARRYGKDRTFSVPILTFCALAGRLGPADRAWKLVPQLPFELAALPQSWFRLARMPVVSYALPALIAIGHVRHHHRPTRNPFAWLARRLAGARTLRVLGAIQPRGGGFLEATPLTSFVVMSLAAGGKADHPVVTNGIDFLVRSARPDGSWPIDTNLATWVTTLSINALAAGGSVANHLGHAEREAIRGWIIGQQYRVRHPYTGAAPGGWAWTDLPGGVPDADDTAGALLALHHLGTADETTLDAVRAAVRWLLDLQNRDGGIPTFCRGWGKLPFDRSAPDLTAHALLAFKAWRGRVPPPLVAEIDRASDRAIANLQSSQRPDGSWVPLWFGNQAAAEDENPTYGTSRVLAALQSCDSGNARLRPMIDHGLNWLLSAQNPYGGWGGAPGVRSSVEETCQAIVALSAARGGKPTGTQPFADAIQRAAAWVAVKTGDGGSFAADPIGLYFAKLWYSERLYPLIGAVAALGAAQASR
jgi:squalene-hopene/tetraprenyl-beta-curcumene cyclase